MDSSGFNGKKIMINLTFGDKIQIGSKVVYIQDRQTYLDNKNQERYKDVDVSKAVGIVIDIFQEKGKVRSYQVEFIDNSFLPEPIQNVPYWYIMAYTLELW